MTLTSRTINIKTLLTVFCVVVVALCTAPFAYAQTATEYGAVINLSGKQRMLTQKMSKEVTLIALDINTAENISNLKATSSLFDKTLKGLRNGDSDLKLPPTSSKRVLFLLGKIDDLWADFYPVVTDIVNAGSVSDANLGAIASKNLPLLKAMNKAVGAYEKEAAKTGLKAAPGLATTLNLSGKQRMLTQKMSKEFLLVALGHQAAENKLNLLETFTLFERTLVGLKVGDDTLGLPATEDKAIFTQLNSVSKLWDEAKPAFVSASQGKKISEGDIEKVATLNLPLLREMNKAVGMYEQLASQ